MELTKAIYTTGNQDWILRYIRKRYGLPARVRIASHVLSYHVSEVYWLQNLCVSFRDKDIAYEARDGVDYAVLKAETNDLINKINCR